MKVVHVFPPQNRAIGRYVDLLAKNMPQGVLCEMCEAPTLLPVLCASFQPDIIHLHGQLEIAQPKQQQPRLVITTHGARVARIEAYALIARSRFELQRLETQGARRIEVIQNPLITKQANFSTCSAQTLKVYQKVMNSDLLALMNEETKHAVRHLLKTGITGDKRWIGEMLETAGVQWQRLFNYSYREGVLPLVQQGCQTLGLQVPTPVIEPSYLPEEYCQPDTNAMTSHVLQIINGINDSVAHKQLALLQLCDLDKALRRDDVEDDLLLNELCKEKRQLFFASLLQLLHEQTGLDEGFMPCKPLNNAETNKLRNLLKRHLQII